MGKDMKDWVEVTIRTPGKWAEPDDMHRVISELFCHDSVLKYQQRSSEAGLRDAVCELRAVLDKKFAEITKEHGRAPQDIIQLAEGLLDLLDPDAEAYGGHYPGTLVCPLHKPERTPVYRSMLPVFSKCPGVPRCRAHEGVRVE